ncbi:MAG: HAMP domain-containing histidine kinase [Candidatus Marinimicrobia bacterium]|nr:HAMP domain-containing histidine kinase [Candidatus Neomarinimicrobiota bacterium]
MIYKGSDRLKHTLDEIVDISSIESGLYLKESGEHHMEQLVQEVCSRFETAALEKLLAFKLDINIESDLVELDANAVSKALYNLIDNAVKYTKKGGVWISMRNAPGLILLDIRDTGIGFSYEFRERLYEPFSQGSEGFTKNFQGIGLGLALAKRYLDINHIGLELLDSKQGGSIFRLKIPLKTESSQRESTIVVKQPMKRVPNGSLTHPGILL